MHDFRHERLQVRRVELVEEDPVHLWPLDRLVLARAARLVARLLVHLADAFQLCVGVVDEVVHELDEVLLLDPAVEDELAIHRVLFEEHFGHVPDQIRLPAAGLAHDHHRLAHAHALQDHDDFEVVVWG